MKNKVQEWIREGCNFDHGLKLLTVIGKNKQLPRIMAGSEKRYAGKLLYELCKAGGFSMHEFQEMKESLLSSSEQSDGENTGISNSDNPGMTAEHKPETVEAKALPDNVQRVIKEHSDLFKLRAQLHEQMTELPEDNSQETVKKRKNLSDSIAQLSPRIDLMFAAKESFYTEGKLPDMKILFPEPPADDPGASLLPSDPAELKKLKKNLQSANTKDQNMLEFQDAKKGDKPNPMPAGPKRQKLEFRIKDRIAQIEEIDYKILSLDNQNE
jgi:hypothetical protein